MIDALVPEDDTSTPLDHEERQGLRLSYITLRGELNEAEQANILVAEKWAFARKRDVLEERMLSSLHKRMFGNVWKWAGTFRTSEKNIGVEPLRIRADLRQLIEDCRYQVAHESYPPDELAARFHHRLVAIHPYPNGNGRHARLATDLLLVSLRHPRFTWGSANLVDPDDMRRRYVSALRSADRHDYAPLLNFVRS